MSVPGPWRCPLAMSTGRPGWGYVAPVPSAWSRLAHMECWRPTPGPAPPHPQPRSQTGLTLTPLVQGSQGWRFLPLAPALSAPFRHLSARRCLTWGPASCPFCASIDLAPARLSVLSLSLSLTHTPRFSLETTQTGALISQRPVPSPGASRESPDALIQRQH